MSKNRTIQSSAPRRLPDGYAEDPSAGPMLRFQASLPQLPVPPLASTIAKYLESVQPHLSPAEYATTYAHAQTFLASPLAADLQRRLEARAADPAVGNNWLADWWNEVAYMGYRDPVVVFVSYFYVHVDDARKRGPAERAARLLKAMLPFRALTESYVVRGCLDVVADVSVGDGSSRNRSVGHRCAWIRTSGCQSGIVVHGTCADGDARFHACRYPVKPCDTAAKFDPRTHDHVVFVRKNKFFEVSLVSPEGVELSAAELEVCVVVAVAGCFVDLLGQSDRARDCAGWRGQGGPGGCVDGRAS